MSRMGARRRSWFQGETVLSGELHHACIKLLWCRAPVANPCSCGTGEAPLQGRNTLLVALDTSSAHVSAWLDGVLLGSFIKVSFLHMICTHSMDTCSYIQLMLLSRAQQWRLLVYRIFASSTICICAWWRHRPIMHTKQNSISETHGIERRLNDQVQDMPGPSACVHGMLPNAKLMDRMRLKFTSFGVSIITIPRMRSLLHCMLITMAHATSLDCHSQMWHGLLQETCQVYQLVESLRIMSYSSSHGPARQHSKL